MCGSFLEAPVESVVGSVRLFEPATLTTRRTMGLITRYSTPARHGAAPTFTGCIGGRNWGVILALALRGEGETGASS